MNRLKGNFEQIDLLNIGKQGFGLSNIPAQKVPGSDAEDLKRIVALVKKQDPQLAVLMEAIMTMTVGPVLDLKLPKNVPTGLTPSSKGSFTMAVGLQGQAFAVVGVTAGMGLYGSTAPELGVFFSLGGGWWTNVGASAGVALTFIFGSPADLTGVSWGVGADCRFMVGSAGALLLFSPPPFRFLGFSVGLSAGPSAIPAFDVTLQVSNTWAKPILQ